MFTLYWIGFVSARKPYWIGLLFTHGCGGAISVTERRCAPPISKVESVTYRMGVHAPDSVSCQRENQSSIWWCKCITLFAHFFAVTAQFSYVKLPNFPCYDNANLQRPGERLLTTTNLSFSFLKWICFFRIKLQGSSPSLEGVNESFLKWRFRHCWNRCELPNSWYRQKSSTLITKKYRINNQKLILWMNIFLPCLLFRTYSLTN